ncbi:hypothetical protein CAPTEDRAFT_195329 [Capitella teleta]|uniref:RNA cytidine acetyltransferase n=1 Tax=Capitella teleta TaxID=283909 RepID=R7TK64_CAPTE|nr:hypothetical protein CAPTEDRAFT_195329 [Capitella teleta]|eukprot:ELT91505.1 hypothetical protein CAPTEDRAFT_195329 [Capitella teleta]
MRKKIDNRIRVLIENGVAQGHRTMFVVVGNRARDQVVILHHMLSKAVVRSRPSVLWCYKKDLGFSSHRKKRMRRIEKKIKTGKLDLKEDDPFELFVAATNIRYSYYHETHKVLGSTYGMCVLQDFEAMSPNLLARTVETVEGGGLIVLLLHSVDSLRQLYTMTMDVHSRYRTESHQDIVGRFNERFILSLASCKTCMVIDDQLNPLPLSSHTLSITALPPKPIDAPQSPEEEELGNLKESLQDTQPVGVLVNCCKTLDQAKAVLRFIEAISEKTLRSTVTMTAARGRGKSAALGLALASAVAFGYSNIFVTSPSPENLKTLFEFIFKGFDALEYQEHLDYELVQSTNPEFNKAIIRVNIFREHRQTIQYIHPADAAKLGQAELVCIDEAAAIPLPLVKALLGPYLVFMSSTINGYEGTGRSLSLKLIQQLRQQSVTTGNTKAAASKTQGEASASGRVLHEITLNQSIRYSNGDAVEDWLNKLLCLDVSNVARVSSGCPVPTACELYYVNRDTLFSYHKASESFLQRLMALYVASHYKNSPNDLQMLSDAPAHHIFCLLGPVDLTSNALPEILCVLQVCLEGEISKQTIMNSLSRGKRGAGDLIPWTVTQQFQDADFGNLSGARVVRIATHSDYQGMGYGSRALELLEKYFMGKMTNLAESSGEEPAQEAAVVDSESVELLTERLTPRKNLPPLLLKLDERTPEKLDYLGVSYGMTTQLLQFWKRAGYVPLYLRQTQNELTGEHSCIMIKVLKEEAEEEDMVDGDHPHEPSWMKEYFRDFRRRFISLLSYQFRAFTPQTALSVLQQKGFKEEPGRMSVQELHMHLTQYDLKRLNLYSQNMVDYHLIMDLMPMLGRLFFQNQMCVHLSAVQAAILLGLGLQHKTVDDLQDQLELPSSQILGLFNRSIRKIIQHLNEIEEKAVEGQMVKQREIVMQPVRQTMDQELSEAASEVIEKQKASQGILLKADLTEFEVRGTDSDWKEVLADGKAQEFVTVKGGNEKKRKPEADPAYKAAEKKKKMKKYKKKV